MKTSVMLRKMKRSEGNEMRKVKDINLLASRFSTFPSLFLIGLSFNLPVVTTFIANCSCQDLCGVVVTTCHAGKNTEIMQH